MKTLDDCMKNRSQNLNIIKFIAAILVIFSHSFHVTMGSAVQDPIYEFTNRTVSFGAIAVAIFLFASGLYVCNSLFQARSAMEYFIKRVKRIFPLLWFVILVTTFIMGPVVTTLNVGEYFKSSVTYKYLLYMVLVPVYHLPGVFEGNYSNIVNESLWALILEVMCYIVLFMAYKMKMLNKKAMKVIIPIIAIMFVIIFICKPNSIYKYAGYLRPLFIFAVGVIFYLFKDKIVISWKYGLAALAALVITFLIGWANVGMILFFPYVLCVVIYSEFQCGKFLSSLGLYSYAMYLVAFPIQQLVVMYGLGTTPVMNTIVSSVITVAVSIVLYYCVEKPGAKAFDKIKIR